MPDEVAVAAETPEFVDPTELSEAQLAEFMKTGQIPGETISEASAEEQAAESGTVSETVEEQETEEQTPKRETRGERRFRKLTAENKSLRERIAALENSRVERPVTARAESSPTTSKAPKLKTFTDQIGTKYADWEAAQSAHEDALDEFHAKQRKEAVAEAIKQE